MHMSITIFMGIIIILYGIILLRRGRFMMSGIYSNIIPLVIGTTSPIIKWAEIGEVDPFIFIITTTTLLGILINRGRYTIYNVNDKMVSDILINILEEKGISYEEKKESYDKKENILILEDYDNKYISYKQSFDSVSIDLKDIKILPFYEDVKDELKIRIREIDSKLFPTTGVIMIGLGIIFIIIMEYL